MTEWAALLGCEDKIRALMAEGVDPELADRMVWGE